MTRAYRARICGLTLALALGLAACGGGSPSPGASSASAAGAASAGESATASVAESVAESMAESAAPSQAAFDIGSAATDVSSLDSYQMDIATTTGADTQTLSVLSSRTPVTATEYTLTGSEDLSLITIEGQGTWIEQGGTWIAAPGGADLYLSMFDALAPDTLLSAYSLAGYGGYMDNQGIEDHNGVSCTHLHLDANSPGAAQATDFPADGTADAWVANDGNYLVGVHYAGTDADTGERTEVSIEVTRVNDPSISIQAPL